MASQEVDHLGGDDVAFDVDGDQVIAARQDPHAHRAACAPRSACAHATGAVWSCAACTTSTGCVIRGELALDDAHELARARRARASGSPRSTGFSALAARVADVGAAELRQRATDARSRARRARPSRATCADSPSSQSGAAERRDRGDIGAPAREVEREQAAERLADDGDAVGTHGASRRTRPRRRRPSRSSVVASRSSSASRDPGAAGPCTVKPARASSLAEIPHLVRACR